MNDFRHSLQLRVDWADLDLFGHVNNVAFFKYMQAGRVAYCDKVGLSSLNLTPLSFMVAGSSCSFKQPLKYPGIIRVLSKVNWVKNTSFELEHLIVGENNELYAQGKDVLVVFDHHSKQKRNVDEELLERLNQLENRSISKIS